MKKFILIIITIAFFIYPSICLSSYLIELKNGSTFITNHYWKEGRQIKFYYRGGIVGISKNLVRKISESDLLYIKEEPQPAKKGKDESEEKPDDEQLYKNQRIALSIKVREALDSYKRAKEVGDRDRIAEEFRRVSQISSELEDLEKEVKAKNSGILPSWWREEPENRE